MVILDSFRGIDHFINLLGRWLNFYFTFVKHRIIYEFFSYVKRTRILCVDNSSLLIFTNHTFIALCQFSVTVADFGLFLPGPVKLRIRPRTLCRFICKVFSLLLSSWLCEDSDGFPRPLLAKTDWSDTSLLPNGAVVKPLALTTHAYENVYE